MSEDSCKFNSCIICIKQNKCAICGWNPTVTTIRKSMLRCLLKINGKDDSHARTKKHNQDRQTDS